MIFYKYRTIDNFQFFVDIIINKRLYAASYSDLNDLMEGHYRYHTNEVTKQMIESINNAKQKIGICSLSKNHNNELMWAHYANGHRGIAFGVEIDHNEYDVRDIVYDGLNYVSQIKQNNDADIAKDILSHKLDFWSYEEEVRAFVLNKKYIDVTVKELIVGKRMSNANKSLIKKVINKLDPSINIITLS